VSNACVILVFAVYGLDAFTGDNLVVIILLLELFGLAVLPFVYNLSRLFQSSSSAYAKVCVGLVVLTFAPLLTVMVLRLPGLGYQDESRIIK
jgi:hypothetical protein